MRTMLPDPTATDRQLPLELAARPALDREAFYVSGSNQHALKLIEGWKDWPDGRICLTGDSGAGKTHLSQVWSALAAPVHACSMRELTSDRVSLIDGSEHVLIDGIEEIDEETVFLHLMNRLAGGGGRLLCTARQSPAKWPVRLADLRSRLAAMAVIPLAAPDDKLLAALFYKQFQDRQIVVSDSVVNYLTIRIERTGLAVGKIVKLLDNMSLARKKPITLAMAAEALARFEQGGVESI